VQLKNTVLALSANTALALLCLSQLLALYSSNAVFQTISSAFLLLFIGLQWRGLGRREHYLIAASITLSVLTVWRSANATEVLLSSVHKAAFLASFMMLLATLREGASRSASVSVLGRWVSSRPPGKRYISISAGGQVLGILLNFGALNLLGPLLVKGAASSSNGVVREWRLRRQLVALGQGFAWLIAWSPTAVTGATAAAVIDGSQPLVISLIGFLAAVGSIFIGWLYDKRQGALARNALGSAAVVTSHQASALPVQAAQRFAMLCMSLMSLSLSIKIVLGVGLIPALMLCSPLVSLLWLELQRRRHTLTHESSSLGLLIGGLRSGADDAIVLACGGFMGLVMAALVDADSFAAQLSLLHWPVAFIYCLVMALIPLLSNLAIPPILSVTFIGSLLNAATLPHVDSNLLACSLVIGWVLNLNGSMFGVANMIHGRISGRPTRELAWRWHGPLSVLTWLWCCILIVTLSVYYSR